MAHGFMYLVVIMDWYSRYVLAWRISNSLDADFCVEALEEALKKGRPDVFNTDQGSQFTGKAWAFTGLLEKQGVTGHLKPATCGQFKSGHFKVVS